MTDYSTWWQTGAAICSAVAAIASARVAMRFFKFQKNSLLKQASIDQMIKLIQVISYLKRLGEISVLDSADNELEGLKSKIAEAKACISYLDSIVSKSAKVEMKVVHDFVYGLQEESIFSLGCNEADCKVVMNFELANNAIQALQRIYYIEVE